MKVSEAKRILTIMAGENEVGLESVLAVIDMIDDLERDAPLKVEKKPEIRSEPEPKDPEPEKAAAPKAKKASRGKESTKDSCRNCFYGTKAEITYEDGSKHPGRKCSKDGRTHSDEGICSSHLRRGKKLKETA